MTTGLHDAQSWLELDEGERIEIVIDYHRRARVTLENAKVHAVAHVVVENQIALGDPPSVSTTLARLMNEGLDRHDAVHAVGSVVMGVVFNVLRDNGANRDVNEQYKRKLATLTAASWRAQADSDDD